jgi:hypothetical protein
MPEGREHWDFCQRWSLQPNRFHCGCPLGLYRKKCPLDTLKRANGDDWHSFHSVKRVTGYSGIERPPQSAGSVVWPEIGVCVAWVQKALKTLEPGYEEFRSQLGDVSDEQLRWCWTAHLVADFACDYCYVAISLKGKYRHVKSGDPSFWALFCDYVTDVRNRIVSEAN